MYIFILSFTEVTHENAIRNEAKFKESLEGETYPKNGVEVQLTNDAISLIIAIHAA